MPIDPNTPPIEARPVAELPAGQDWRYEPKWDGFRCLAFRDGDHLELRSKSGQPLARYFPDIAAVLLALKPKHFALDGEIVIPVERRLSFEALQLRLHPAESRVRKLAAEHPAVYVAFDLLEDARGRSLLDQAFDERRNALEAFFAKELANPAIRLSPSTAARAMALGWLDRFSGDIDGVIAKRTDRNPLRPDHRRPLPPRHNPAALAPRQGAAAMHLRPVPSRRRQSTGIAAALMYIDYV